MGRLSVGESAGLNYGWIVNRPDGQRIETGLTAFGAHDGLTHPPVQLLTAPAVYGFDGGVPGTLPLWRDPGYWHEGAVHRFDPARQAQAVWRTTGSGPAGARLGPVPRRPRGARRRRPPDGSAPGAGRCSSWRWPSCRSACTSRSTSSIATSAPSSSCCWPRAFAAIRLPDTPGARRLTGAVVTAVFVAQVTPVAAMVAYDAAHEVKGLVRGDPLIHRHWQIARGLQEPRPSTRRPRRGGRRLLHGGLGAPGASARDRGRRDGRRVGADRRRGCSTRCGAGRGPACVRWWPRAARWTMPDGPGSATGTRGRAWSPAWRRGRRRPGCGDAHRARRPRAAGGRAHRDPAATASRCCAPPSARGLSVHRLRRPRHAARAAAARCDAVGPRRRVDAVVGSGHAAARARGATAPTCSCRRTTSARWSRRARRW